MVCLTGEKAIHPKCGNVPEIGRAFFTMKPFCWRWEAFL
jgi:hypothetical protein